MKIWRIMTVAAGVGMLAGASWLASDRDRADQFPGRTNVEIVKRTRIVPESDGMKDFPASVIRGAVPEIKLPVSGRNWNAAAEEARQIPSPSLREETTRRVVQDWAVEDPVSALSWAAGLPDPHESEIAMTQICSRVADTDPALAIRLAMDRHLDEIPGDLVGGFTAGWASRDLSAARGWVNSQPEGPLRDSLMERVVFELAKTDPSAAARMVAERMESGEAQVEAAISVISQWIKRDPEAAMSWVEAFPDGLLKERALQELSSGMKVGQAAAVHEF